MSWRREKEEARLKESDKNQEKNSVRKTKELTKNQREIAYSQKKMGREDANGPF